VGLITVIIPTYNWSTVLPYSIGSVLGQTFTDFELLVVGDGCTDDSEQVVKAIPDPRVRWIGIPRTGHQSGPNNEGLRQARGELIAYLGHDDLWLPHHLQILVAAIERGADFAHSLVAMIPPPGSGRPLAVAPPQWKPPSSILHKRSVSESIGGWRHFRELKETPDGDFWMRVEAAGYKLEFVPRLTVLKFPALWRPGVYRDRPFHEQAAWLERIRTEPDLEVVELGKIASRQQPPSILERLTRLLAHPTEWPSVIWRRKGGRVRAWQRVKGVKG
jgi:glycosyltransferase involved in cell wall biosynthesis